MANPNERIGTDAAPPGGGSRTLTGLEKAMRITDFDTPFGVVSVLRLDGHLPPPALRTALDALQRRHPLLRAGIHDDKSGYAFHFDVAGPIPLETSERPGLDSWVAAAEEELHRRFDLAAGPLMRCRYLVDRSGGDLIVTIHHSIIDATSAVRLFGELLTFCAGWTPGPAGDMTQEGRVPATALYPDEYAGLRLVWAFAKYMGRQMADELKFRWRSRGVRKPAIGKTGRCRLVPVRMSAALTAALVEASRRHRVTLNAILGASMMAAVQRRLYPSPRAPLRHITFADLRPRLRKAVPDAMLGCFLSMFRFTVVVKTGGGFWPLAQEIQESTIRAARSGERYLAYSMSPGMISMLIRLKAFRMGATTLSYGGPIDLPTAYGSFEVTGLHAFAANMTTGPEYSALVRLFRGELWWDIMYMDCDMDAAMATQIARDMQAILEEATC